MVVVAPRPALLVLPGSHFHTAGGKISAIVGEAPKRVAINEWDSLEQAQAFYNSKAWKDLAPQHNKAQKLTRLYAVEAIKKVGRFRTRQSRKRDPARTEEGRGLDGVSNAPFVPKAEILWNGHYFPLSSIN
jgi:uncharacterized protein (DUF1330 family)